MKTTSIIIMAFFSCTMFMAGCSKSNSGTTVNPGGSSSVIISIRYMAFSPAAKSVKKGTVVEWDNNDATPHTATSNDGTTFNTGSIPAGGNATYTANTTGTFSYHCTIHGVAMSGTLTVTP